jgi:hypothetical protein
MKTEILLFIQSEIVMLKQQYREGKIDLKTLQTACRALNRTAEFVCNTN